MKQTNAPGCPHRHSTFSASIACLYADRPHGLKYRLWAGRDDKTLVRYNNESGNGEQACGPHREAYAWQGMSVLMEDFLNDVEALK